MEVYPDRDLIIHSLYVLLEGRVLVSSCPCHLKYSVYLCMAWVLFQKTCTVIIHIYINITCEGFHVTDECFSAVVFLFSSSA